MTDYPPTGERIDIGGYRLHLHRMGSGSPAVVMDSGLGATSLLYELILPRIAELTTAVAYDRAGYAWSDPAPSDVPRTSRQLVTEMRALLEKAAIPPPYVLVGNSFGAINCLHYNSLYPDEVAGIVLIDPSHPEMFERMPDIPPPERVERMASIFVTLARLKLIGLVAPLLWRPIIPGWKHLPLHVQQAQAAFNRQPGVYDTWRRESASGAESFRQVREAGYDLGEKPLIVLAAGAWWVTGDRRFGISERMKQAAQVLGKELAAKSSRGRYQIVENGSHSMQVDQPDVVVDAVREVVAAARAKTA
jgi:pimeloyl-ACP methyl ester carboxylesterase